MSGKGGTKRGPDFVSHCPDRLPWSVPGPPWDATDCLLSAQNCPQKKYTNLYTFLGASFWSPGRPLENRRPGGGTPALPHLIARV